MVRLPRGLKQGQVVTAFVKAGGQERAGKGSHRVIKMPNGRNISIPFGTVKDGLLQTAIKRADLTVEEFIGHLG